MNYFAFCSSLDGGKYIFGLFSVWFDDAHVCSVLVWTRPEL